MTRRIPQLVIPNMTPFGFDDGEHDVFKRWHYSAYYTGLFNNTGLQDGCRYVNVGTNTTYHIPGFGRAVELYSCSTADDNRCDVKLDAM